MMKPEYSNRFDITGNKLTKEVVITFYASWPDFDDKGDLIPQKTEVSRVLLPYSTAKGLIEAVQKCLSDFEKKQSDNSPLQEE